MFLELNRDDRSYEFLPDNLADIPALYSTEETPAGEKIIWAHYFLGSLDWWIAELDPAQNLAFGFCCLMRQEDAEWGYVNLEEIENLRIPFEVEVNGTPMVGTRVVDLDLDFMPRVASLAIPSTFHRDWWGG